MKTENFKRKLREAVLPQCKVPIANIVIEEFVEKLSFDDLLTLTNLITSEETETALFSSNCIEIDSQNPKFEIENPILCCVQMWRWPSFDKERELIHKGPNSNNQRICINPYHYESVGTEINLKSTPKEQPLEVAVDSVQALYPEMQLWDETVPEPKCRVCLTTNILFDWNEPVTDADQWISHEITYAECFYDSTQLAHGHDDMEKKLPHFLCSSCKTELRLAYIFICKARHADRMLRLKQEKSEHCTSDGPLAITKIESEFELVIAEKMDQKNSSLAHAQSDATDLLDKLEATATDDYNSSSKHKNDTEFVEEKEQRLSPKVRNTRHPRHVKLITKKEENPSSPAQTEDCDTDLQDELSAATDNSNSSTALTLEESEYNNEDAISKEQEPMCNKSSSRRYRVKKTVDEKNPVVCEYCSKPFAQPKLLRAHIARLHQQPQLFLCHSCPRTFRDTNTLRQHSQTHQPNRTREFACELCESKFFTNSAFKTHMKTHESNRKPLFDCDECDKSFLHKGSLKLHKKIHTGENLACQICDKRYLRQIDLDIHMRTHSGHMPFKCHYAGCDKAFNQVGLLNKHLLQHEGYRYKCDICAKEYNNRAMLAQHRKEHTGMPLKCGICDKGFVNRYKITRHIGGVHKVEDPAEMDKTIVRMKTKKECRIMIRNPKPSYVNAGQN